MASLRARFCVSCVRVYHDMIKGTLKLKELMARLAELEALEGIVIVEPRLTEMRREHQLDMEERRRILADWVSTKRAPREKPNRHPRGHPASV